MLMKFSESNIASYKLFFYYYTNKAFDLLSDWERAN